LKPFAIWGLGLFQILIYHNQSRRAYSFKRKKHTTISPNSFVITPKIMKNLRIIAPAVLSLLTIAIALKTNAQAEINPTPEGFEVTVGDCYVLFNHSGSLLQGGPKCDDVEMYDAKQAAKSYVNEQSGSGSEHTNQATPIVNDLGNGNYSVDIAGGCSILFNSSGNMIQKGSSCSSSDINKAKNAMGSYLREQGGSGYGENPNTMCDPSREGC
jgi:hypothetical protein